MAIAGGSEPRTLDADPSAAVPQSPRRSDARRNREQIRLAAMELFRVNGLETPLQEVASLAGVSKGTIYHRYGSRQSLIDDVAEQLVSPGLAQVRAAVSAARGPRARFTVFLRTVCRVQYEQPAVNDVLAGLLPESPLLIALCKEFSEFGHALLQAAQDAGEVRADLAPEHLDYLVWERSAVLRAGKRPPLESYERILDMILDGLLVTPDVTPSTGGDDLSQ